MNAAQTPGNPEKADKLFVRKVWTTAAIAAFIVIVLLIFKTAINVLLLVLASSLIAIYFRGLSSLIQKKTNLSSGLSTAISIVGTLIIIVGLSWFIGAKIQTQLTQLVDQLPTTVENAKTQLSKNPIGQRILEYKQSGKLGTQKVFSSISTFFRTSFGILGDIYIILFIGIFFTADPSLYSKGFLKLIPVKSRVEGERVLNKIGHTLFSWLMGKIFSMVVVAILTAIGLYIIGLPMTLALAIIAGLLNFIPNFGPLIAMIPAVLIALLQGPQTALIVAGLYLFIQLLESNVLTPLVQNKLVSIPPAMIIIGQVLMGTLVGGWGIILATPVVLIFMVLTQELYIKKQEKIEI